MKKLIYLFLMIFFIFNSFSKGAEKSGKNFANSFMVSPSYFMPATFKKGDKNVKVLKNLSDVIAFTQTMKGRVLFTKSGAYIGIVVREREGKDIEVPFNNMEFPDKDEYKARGRVIVLKNGFFRKNKKDSNFKVELKEKTEARANFFTGDKKDWVTGVPLYRKLVYEGVWKDIDVEYIGYMDRLEFRVKIKPGANPSNVVMETGAKKLKLNGDGSLSLSLESGKLRITKPHAYQIINGKKIEVEVSILPLENGRYTFKLGRYDKKHLLIIDPVLVWSTYLGGTANQWMDYNAIAVNNNGNVYVAGYTNSPAFPVNNTAYDKTYNGALDCFVAKFSQDGSSLDFCTYIGGSDNDWINAIVIDSNGNVYVCGGTQSTDFPTTTSAFSTGYNGGGDAFVCKLNSTGSGLIYSTYIGGDHEENAFSIDIDSNGNAYITGKTLSSNFPTTSGAYDTTFNSNASFYDAFVTKLNSDGSDLVYSTYLGGDSSGDDIGYGIKVDSDGHAFVTGFTYSDDFPTTPGAFQTASQSHGDAFVTKLNSDGSDLVYSTYLGGGGLDRAYSIAIDGDGNAYITGYTASSSFPTTSGAFDTDYNGGLTDAFVTKLNPTGSNLVYSTYLGGGEYDNGRGITIDSNGNAYVVGITRSNDLPMVNAYDSSYNTHNDAFVMKLNSNGSNLLYSTYLGGSDIDRGYAIAVDPSKNIYVAGYTFSSDFPVTPGAFQGSYTGGLDVFVTKINSEGNDLVFSTYLSGGHNEWVRGIAVDSSDFIYVAVNTTSQNFPVVSGGYDTSFNGSRDIVVLKLSPDGNSLVYSTFLGGSGTDMLWDIKIDNNGNVFGTGMTTSSDFPVTSGAFDTSYNGDWDGFVFKLNSDGSNLIFSTYLGGNHKERLISLDIDDEENVYVTGHTESSNFPTTPGVVRQDFQGPQDIFVSELAKDGSSLIHSTLLGGSTGGEGGIALCIDNDKNIYVTGWTYSSDFPVTTGAFQSNLKGDSDTFVIKLKNDFSSLIYSTYLGGDNHDVGVTIRIDNSKNVYVAGYTWSSDFPITPNAPDNSCSSYEGFITKLNPEGTALIFSTFLGGTDNDFIDDILLDSDNNVYVCGTTYSSDLPVSDNAYSFHLSGRSDALIAKLNSDGTNFLYCSYIGGSGKDNCSCMTFNSAGMILCGGSTTSEDFPGISGHFDESYHFGSDAFVFELGIDFYTLTYTAGAHGSISGPANQIVHCHEDGQPVTAIPDAGYQFDQWSDGVTDNPRRDLDVTHDINVTAEFSLSLATFTIHASAGEGGSISPSGDVTVTQGEDQTFIFSPDNGYHVSDVIVDGTSTGFHNVNAYTFSSVNSDHTIKVEFATNQPPVIDSFTSDSCVANVPSTITFTCTAHDPDGGSIVQYIWHIEGKRSDTIVTTTGVLEYNFIVEGEYSISVTVVDDEGDTATASLDTSGCSGGNGGLIIGGYSSVAIPLPIYIPTREGQAIIETWAVNEFGEEAIVTLEARDESNTTIATDTITVPPFGSRLLQTDAFDNISYKYVWATADHYMLVYSRVSTERAKMTAELSMWLKDPLYIPHIAEETDYWNTYAFVSNANPRLIKVEAAGESESHESVPAETIDLENFISNNGTKMLYMQDAWGKLIAYAGEPFSYTKTLTGFEMFIKEGNDGAATELSGKGGTTLFIPHIPEETDIFWTGFAFLNTGNRTAHLTFRFYDNEGNPVGTETMEIEPQTKVKGLMKDLFPSESGNARWGIITSDEDINGIEIYGTYHAGICGLALPTIANTYGILPDVRNGEGEWTGIAITNVSNVDANVTIRLIDREGNIKAEKTQTIQSKHRFKAVVSEYFDGVTLEDGDTIRYSSNTAVVSMEASGDLDRTYMTALTGNR